MYFPSFLVHKVFNIFKTQYKMSCFVVGTRWLRQYRFLKYIISSNKRQTTLCLLIERSQVRTFVMPDLIGVVWIGWHLIRLLCVFIVTWLYVVAWKRAVAHPIPPPPDSVCTCLYKCVTYVWGSLQACRHSSPTFYWAWRLKEGACGCGKMTSLHLEVFQGLQQLWTCVNKALYNKEKMSQLQNYL